MMARQDVSAEARIARERADLARARFKRRLGAMRERVSPARLKGDAGDAFLGKLNGAKAAARRAFWRRPVVSGSLLAGTAALVLWKPLSRLAHRAAEAGHYVQHWIERQREAGRNDE